jgi:hypothetical protein
MSFNDAKGIYVYATIVFAILCMKVWRVVFVVKHTDNNPKELANLRHTVPGFVVSTVQR